MLFLNYTFRNVFFPTDPDFDDPSGPLNLLRSIFCALEKISDVTKAEEKLSKELILRLDHAAFGCSCEYPEAFGNSLESIYHEFRLKFNYEVKPRKSSHI